MASAQAAQPVKKNATKIPRQKASARANSTFVQFESCRPMSRYHQSAALVFSRGDDVGMELPALEAAPCCFVLHPPITSPSKLRISFSIGFRNTKTSTLGVVPTRSVTNLGPWDHQGKKVSFVRLRSPSGSFRTTEDRLRSHPAPVSAPGATPRSLECGEFSGVG
jgi:hypothetical protein